MQNISHLSSVQHALLCTRYLLALWDDLVYCYLLVWFSWAWVKCRGIFLGNTNFFFINSKALWSFRIIFTAICGEKMMPTDVSSLTNMAFVIFILATVCCVDTCLHSVLIVVCSSVRVEFSRWDQMYWSIAYEQLICYEGLLKKKKCNAYCLSSGQSWQWKPNRLPKSWVVLL